MGAVDIAVIVIVSVAALGIIGYFIFRKLKGKSIGCDCGCQGCTLCNKKNKK